MLVAQNSLGPVCPVPLTVRGKTAYLWRVAEVEPTRWKIAAAPRDRCGFPVPSLEALEAPFAVIVVVTVALADVERKFFGRVPEVIQRNVGRRRRDAARDVLHQLIKNRVEVVEIHFVDSFVATAARPSAKRLCANQSVTPSNWRRVDGVEAMVQ